MQYPGEQDLLDERSAVLRTMASLDDDTFANGPTLCEEWAPRDVLAHLLGIDVQFAEYVKAYGNIKKANAAIVERYRQLDRAELMAEAEGWSTDPPANIRAVALFLLGDVSIHHQDVLRGMGRNRVLPLPIRDALLREGTVLGWKRLLRYRLEPNDGGRPRGRGQVVTGTSEVLALWLAGRHGLDDELRFC